LLSLDVYEVAGDDFDFDFEFSELRGESMIIWPWASAEKEWH
jgi:hypothetical protein